MLFDETYVHEAFNGAETTRLILFCDVERPVGAGDHPAQPVDDPSRDERDPHPERARRTDRRDQPPLCRLAATIAAGKALKARSRLAYYTVKNTLLVGVLVLLVLPWP